MANNKISELVSKFKLEGHPEGGFYRRFFQSEEMMDTIHGPRHRMTSINFLLTKESFSALHLLKQSNEIFYHHQVMIYYNNFTIIYFGYFLLITRRRLQEKENFFPSFYEIDDKSALFRKSDNDFQLFFRRVHQCVFI